MEVVGGPLRVLHHVQAQTARFLARTEAAAFSVMSVDPARFLWADLQRHDQGWCYVWLYRHGRLVDVVSLP